MWVTYSGLSVLPFSPSPAPLPDGEELYPGMRSQYLAVNVQQVARPRLDALRHELAVVVVRYEAYFLTVRFVRDQQAGLRRHLAYFFLAILAHRQQKAAQLALSEG